MNGKGRMAVALATAACAIASATPDDSVDGMNWSIGYGNTVGDVYVGAVTYSGGNQTRYFGTNSLNDGRWHHVAVTFEPHGSEEKTVIKFYKDHVQAGRDADDERLSEAG